MDEPKRNWQAAAGRFDVRRFLRLIPDSMLSPADVPGAGAAWPDIARFALTLDGWQQSPQRCAGIANGIAARYRATGELPRNLAELRTALFFEQRCFHHFGETPEGEEIAYVRALVDAIRREVTARSG